MHAQSDMGPDMGRQFLLSRAERVRFCRSRPRFLVTRLVFAAGFALIALRLVGLGFAAPGHEHAGGAGALSTAVKRPDIVDRRGRLLASDIQAASVFADPKRVVDLDDTVEQLAGVFPDLDPRALRKKISGGGRFVWVRRELTPRQQAAVHELGLPGIGFIVEPHRVYTSGRTAAHVLGSVDVDNRGLSGVERHIDRSPLILKTGTEVPGEVEKVALSLDLGVQHALRRELGDAMTRYGAKAAAGLVLDVHSGEVLGLSSLPDFDPNRRDEALEKGRFNRLTAGVFELGSVFKLFTTAAALDMGVASLDDGYDATEPLRVASFEIDDFHAKRRWLSVPEIFIYSSNIGSAKMALDVGTKRHKAFLAKLGLLGRLGTEVGETAGPIAPKTWQRINTMTISFGHGISVTPLQFAAAAGAIVNGGYKVTPTFLRRSREEARVRAKRVLKRDTSDLMRYLLRLNVKSGTAKNADAAGFQVGGKTGTAEKVVNGRYSSSALLTSFLGVFPAEAPEYLVLVILDEPQRVEETGGTATAGVNAAPVTRRLVERIGPILGVVPRLEERPAFDEYLSASY